MKLLSLLILSIGLVANAGDPKEILKKIALPPGFKISVYAPGVPNARAMAQSPRGDIYVGNFEEDKVWVVPAGRSIGTPEKPRILLKGLKFPNGVIFHDGDLYVATLTKISKYKDIEKHWDSPPEPTVIVDQLPSEEAHGWKFIRLGPDNKIYFPIGMPCNICKKDDPQFGALHRVNLNGKKREMVANGIRNTVGFDWDPQTKQIWFNDNGRDYMGDDLPPDELNHITGPKMNFGFPYCHGKNVADPEFGKEHKCSEFTAPVHEYQAHVAPLGLRFYTGKMFPEKYRGKIFSAQHGSWNRSTPVGARIVVIDPKNPELPDDVFASGWLQGRDYTGRPVDLEVLKDGSMLVSDDFGGNIYRITYEP